MREEHISGSYEINSNCCKKLYIDWTSIIYIKLDLKNTKLKVQ